MNENEIATIAIGEGITLHKELGPGLLESVYEETFYHRLVKAGLFVEKQKPIPLIWDNVKLDCGYRCDIMIEKKVIIEVKSIDSLADIHLAQMLTYLRITDTKLGLLMNFNVIRLKDGIRRVVNNL